MSSRTYYWDSSVFVGYFNDEEKRADVIEQLLNEATDGKITIITSAFACVEVLKLKNHAQLSKSHEEMI
jgi:predicted nucleic acid-binding protein